jgi:serine protease Do
MDRPRGALVSEVTPESPAASAGILVGDVVTEYDGRPVRERRDLPRMVAETAIGQKVQIKVLRKSVETTVEVTIARLNENEDGTEASAGTPNAGSSTNPNANQTLGMTLSELSPGLREQYGIGEGVAGVVVTGVADNSPSAEKGVEVGDVILEVAQETVATPKEVQEKVDKLKTDKRRIALLLLINREGEHRHVGIRLPQ